MGLVIRSIGYRLNIHILRIILQMLIPSGYTQWRPHQDLLQKSVILCSQVLSKPKGLIVNYGRNLEDWVLNKAPHFYAVMQFLSICRAKGE